jgi:hypothetical protein
MNSAASNLPFNYISTRHKSEFLKGDAGMVLAREKTQYEASIFQASVQYPVGGADA